MLPEVIKAFLNYSAFKHMHYLHYKYKISYTVAVLETYTTIHQNTLNFYKNELNMIYLAVQGKNLYLDLCLVLMLKKKNY